MSPGATEENDRPRLTPVHVTTIVLDDEHCVQCLDNGQSYSSAHRKLRFSTRYSRICGGKQPTRASVGSMAGREGVAAAAVVFAGLGTSPFYSTGTSLWAEVDSAVRGRISDAEMARINIESSSGLEEWLDSAR